MSAVLNGERSRYVNVIPVQIDVTKRGIVKPLPSAFTLDLNGWRH